MHKAVQGSFGLNSGMGLCRRSRPTAWIAIVAILLAALAPDLARALAVPQQAMPWGEICTAAGMQTAGDGLPDTDAGRHGGKDARHCMLCLGHGGHVVLPATPSGFLPAAGSAASAPAVSIPRPLPRPAWAFPHTRAPPAFS